MFAVGGRAFAAVEYDRHMGRRYTRPACDREKKLAVAFEILAQKRAFGGINLEIGRRTRLYAGDRPDQPFGDLAPWRAVGH